MDSALPPDDDEPPGEALGLFDDPVKNCRHGLSKPSPQDHPGSYVSYQLASCHVEKYSECVRDLGYCHGQGDDGVTDETEYRRVEERE